MSCSGDEREAHGVVIEGPGQVSVQRHAVSYPGEGQLRIRVVACGVCQRDLHIIAGRIPRAFPLIAGHEPIGVVDAVGAGTRGFTVGQWVTGVGQSSFSQYENVEARHTRPLREMPPRPEHWLGEPAMCAINAVNRIPACEWATSSVVVFGAGYMGGLLIQAVRTKLHPGRLLAVDVDASRLALARELGADDAVGTDAPVLDALRGRVDLVFEASGAPGTLAATTRLVRNGGVLAVFAHHFRVEPSTVSDWHLRGITVLNTVPWSAPDLARELEEAVAALEAGRLRMDRLGVRTAALDDAPTVLNELARIRNGSSKTVILLPWEA